MVEEEMQAAFPEAELPTMEIATAEGFFSFLLVSSYRKYRKHLDPLLEWPFAGATTAIEGETTSNIADMIEELTQPEGTEIPKISAEVAAVGTTSAAEESSQQGESPKGLPPMSPQLCKISAFNNLSLGVVSDIIVMIVGDIVATQADEPLIGTGVENIPSTSDRVSITIIETRLGSALPVPTPAIDILEELSLQMVRYFFTTIKYCTELVLSEGSSFEFV